MSSLTSVTYWSKLLGICCVAAFMQLELDSVGIDKSKRRSTADDVVDLQHGQQLLSCVFYAGGMKFTLE
ncbi:hypothetical protein DSR74_05545 [Salmonella enterica subsp. enterica serovar Dortmund]|nr:hypothetical protein [Salmonella enterica subsp. enterica serovar Dortmund]